MKVTILAVNPHGSDEATVEFTFPNNASVLVTVDTTGIHLRQYDSDRVLREDQQFILVEKP